MRDAFEETEERYVRFCVSLVPPKRKAARAEAAPREFRTLCTYPGVTAVAATDYGVYVGTQVLTFTDGDGREREIGELLLTISHEVVSWENLTRQVNTYHAPYISMSKTVCGLYSEKQELEMAIKDGRLDTAFALMIVIASKGPGYAVGPSSWPLVKGNVVKCEVVRVQPQPVAKPKRKGLLPWRR